MQEDASNIGADAQTLYEKVGLNEQRFSGSISILEVQGLIERNGYYLVLITSKGLEYIKAWRIQEQRSKEFQRLLEESLRPQVRGVRLLIVINVMGSFRPLWSV